MGFRGTPRRNIAPSGPPHPTLLNPVWNEEPFVFEKVCVAKSYVHNAC